MSKTLSNSVMGLRFMQNAQRAKQQAEVELEQAKIKDEAEWEVSQEVKDAWGIGSSSSASSSSAVVHESSYIPFIFSSAEAETSGEAQSTSKGRRSFNNKGKEVEESKKEVPVAASSSDLQESPTRLTSISGFRAPPAATLPARDTLRPAKGGAKGKSAQELIRQDVRKRPPQQIAAKSSISGSGSAKLAFMKPSGVDAPAIHVPKAKAKGAGNNAPTARKRRDRDESGDMEGKKRKKEMV